MNDICLTVDTLNGLVLSLLLDEYQTEKVYVAAVEQNAQTFHL